MERTAGCEQGWGGGGGRGGEPGAQDPVPGNWLELGRCGPSSFQETLSSGGVVRVRVQGASSKAADLFIHSFITYFLPGAYFNWGLVQW